MDLKIIKDNIGNYQIKYFKEVNSTHNFIKENWKTISNKTIVIADSQTEGIGTHGRVWYTGNNNIAMSILIKPNCDIDKLNNITIEIAKSIQWAIKEKYNINLEIKYPNDLLLNNKKICGILTEIRSISKEVTHLIISIGFNVNEVDFDENILDTATSLKKELKKEYSREEIISEIIKQIDKKIIANLTSQNNENFYQY